MANQIERAELTNSKPFGSLIEQVIDEQAQVIVDLEIAVKMLASSLEYFLAPNAPVALAQSTEIQPKPAPLSRAVENIRGNTRMLDELSDHIDELRNRIAL